MREFENLLSIKNRVILVVFLILFALLSVQSYAETSPIADYHMDACSWNGTPGEVKDNSTNHLDGTAKGGATTTQGKLCKAGKFVQSDSQYLSIDNNNKLNPNSNDWSISVWVKWEGGGGEQIIYNKENLYEAKIVGGKFYYAWEPHWHWDGGIKIKQGVWTHFVVTYDHSKQKVYKNGTLVYERGQNGDIGSNTSKLLIGARGNNNPHNYFNGDIDELEIFSRALNPGEVKSIYDNETDGRNWNGGERKCPSCFAINHYEIIHSSDALTCQPANITVKACSDDNCSTLYTDNAAVTMTPTGWVGGDTHTISGGEAVLQLSHTAAETVELGMSSSNPSADYCCRNSAVDNKCVKDGNHCDITFHKSGFIFDVPNQTSCKASNDVSIEAVRADDTTQKCVPAFADVDKKVDFWFNYQTPSTGTKLLQIKGNAQNDFNDIGLDESSKTPVTLHFDSNGSATFKTKYADAGRLNLYAQYSDTTSGLVMEGEDVYGGSGNGFVVKPWAFYIDIPGNPAAKDANGGVFKKAGEGFDLTIKAVCWQADDNISKNSDLSDNSLTPNFKDSVAIDRTLVAPEGGDSGEIAVTSASISNNGEVDIDNESYNEVGIISLSAADSDYLGAGSIEGSVPYVGRFIPDHFKITKKTDGILQEQCATFNYTGETTTYQTKPSFVITAQNKDNQTTLNYTNDFFKLSANDVKITKPTTDYSQKGADKTTNVSVDIERDVPTLNNSSKGVGVYTFGNDNITYTKDNNSEIAPFAPKLLFVIDNITDSDGVSAVDLPDNVTVSGLDMKYGRLKIFDNYGPETENLKMSVETQFWDGQYWKTNEDDSCTALTKDDFVLKNFTGNLSSGETYIIDNSANGISNGKGSFMLKAPGQNNYGTVDVCLSDNASFYGYLNDTFTCGVATFGIYRGRDRIIEWKEIPAQ